MIGSLTTFAVLAAAALPQAVDGEGFARQPITLASGVIGQTLTIRSHTPVDFGPMFKGELGPAVTLHAQLFVPQGQGLNPAIVLVPGSGGIGPHHLQQANALVVRGIAVLLIDPFGGRGIGETISDPGRLTWAASTYDVVAGVKLLRSLPGINPRRIGAVGSSRGGTAVMLAASRPISDRFLGANGGLATAVAGYPWCGTQFWSARLAKGTTLLVLSGDKDDWVSIQQCQDAVHAIANSGSDATMKIFRGAFHAFDRGGVPPTRLAQVATATTYPTVYMNDHGWYRNLRTGRADQSLTPRSFVQASVDDGFVRHGVTVGTQGKQAAEYVEELVAYLTARLTPKEHDLDQAKR